PDGIVMVESIAFGPAGRCSILALALLVTSLTVAAAQNPEAASEATASAAENSDAVEAAGDSETTAQDVEPLSEEQAAALRDALYSKYDSEPAAAATPRSARPSGGTDLDWNRTAKPDGTTYTVKRTLPVDWNAKIGADLGVND